MPVKKSPLQLDVTSSQDAEPPLPPKHPRWWNWLEPTIFLTPAGIWLILLLVLPTLIIFELSLVPGFRPGNIVNPSGVDNYIQVFQPLYMGVMGRSLFLASASTIICLLLGFPVAYWIA
ncbi:MAG: ABC transporter permease, partial [Chroococcidiopsis sp.]